MITLLLMIKSSWNKKKVAWYKVLTVFVGVCIVYTYYIIYTNLSIYKEYTDRSIKKMLTFFFSVNVVPRGVAFYMGSLKI